MNEMLPESTRCVTGSAVNMGGGKRLLLSEGWRDYSRTRWSYRSDDGRPVTLLGKFTDKNLGKIVLYLLIIGILGWNWDEGYQLGSIPSSCHPKPRPTTPTVFLIT